MGQFKASLGKYLHISSGTCWDTYKTTNVPLHDFMKALLLYLVLLYVPLFCCYFQLTMEPFQSSTPLLIHCFRFIYPFSTHDPLTHRQQIHELYWFLHQPRKLLILRLLLTGLHHVSTSYYENIIYYFILWKYYLLSSLRLPATVYSIRIC